MKSVRMASLISSLVAIAAAAFGSSGTAMLPAPQRNAPAALVVTTHTSTDLLQSAKAHNNNNKRLVAYRIGWAYVFRSEFQFHKGPMMNVPVGIAPHSDFDVPAQAIPLNRNANAVVFFVAQVTFADGSQWKSSQQQIRRSVAKTLTSLTGTQE